MNEIRALNHGLFLRISRYFQPLFFEITVFFTVEFFQLPLSERVWEQFIVDIPLKIINKMNSNNF